jgi:hypothetical protein
MRVIFFLIGLTTVSGCATDDSVSDRRYGQQLVCHKGHTQAVSTADSFVHQNHGDSLGPCPKDQ